MTEEKTGNVIKDTKFKTKDDWISKLLDTHCVDKNVGAVEAVAEVKDADGKVTTPGVRAKAGKDAPNLDALRGLADENNITYKEYPNPGMYRMNIGNMLRAAARKRHGLNVKGEFQAAPADFKVNEIKTHNPDGSKIVAAKAEAEAPAE